MCSQGEGLISADQIHIEAAETIHSFEEARVLLYQELGSFFSRENIQEKGNGGIMINAFIGKEGREIAGAAFACEDREKNELFLEKAGIQIEKNLRPLHACGLVVAQRWRGRGIGKRLLLAREEEAKKRGHGYLLITSWLESPSPSAPLLRSVGMREIAQIPAYWQKKEPLKDYCPRCGDICTCTALLFYKYLGKDLTG